MQSISIKTTVVVVITIILCSAVNAQRRRSSKARVQSVTVMLTEKGYQPESLKLRQGVPAKVTFIRKVSPTCATDVVIDEYSIRRPLPLNEPVLVEFTPKKSGTFMFACGMGMLRGTLVVR